MRQRIRHAPIRYRLHRILHPVGVMRLLHEYERHLRRKYHRTLDRGVARRLDAVAWFNTPYEGARQDSRDIRFHERLHENMYYGLFRFRSNNVRWWV